MSGDEDPLRRDRWARLRFAIIGPLLAAPPAPGQLQAALNELAARTWRHPLTRLDVRFGTSTIQRWFYACREATDPVAVLRNQVRHDIGSFPSVSPQAAEALRALYQQHSSCATCTLELGVLQAQRSGRPVHSVTPRQTPRRTPRPSR